MGNILIEAVSSRTPKWIQNPGNKRDAERFRTMVELCSSKYGEQYGVNYLLITAQAYQESGLDQNEAQRGGRHRGHAAPALHRPGQERGHPEHRGASRTTSMPG